MNFKDLGLCPELLRVIDELGYKEPTPVQAKAIPPILEGRDMVGSAQTGTGKTAAFALPTLQRLEKPGNAGPWPWPRLANWPSRSKKTFAFTASIWA